jgi:hypothetical protein
MNTLPLWRGTVGRMPKNILLPSAELHADISYWLS